MTSPVQSQPSSPTIASAIFAADRLARNLVAFETSDGTPLSYRECLLATERLVRGLRELGINSADRVAFMAPRGAVGVIGFIVISSVAICCPLNPRLRAEELEAAIQSMQITAVVDAGSNAVVQQAAARHALPVLSLTAGGGGALDIGVVSQRARTAAGSGSADTPEVALMMQTSGTTSKPKLVALTHGNVLSAAGAIRSAFRLNEADICLNPMPLHHVHGLISAGIASLLSGSRVICTDNFSATGFERILAERRPSWFTASPAMHLATLEHFKNAGRTPLGGHLRFFRSSSAPLPASAIGELERLFEAPLVETYGLTETASMICSNPLPPGVRKPGSVGIAFGAEIRVADENGKDRPAHQNGEILVRGPSVIKRYGVTADLMPEAFFGDWLRTGDLGYLDDDGYLFIVGRTKELIKRGGLSIYPAEIDNVLTSHPDVAEAVTFSIPHPTLGEELVAAVVPRANTAPTDAQLRAHIAGQLSAYKVPARVLVIETIPKNDTGKIIRREMAVNLAEHFRPGNVVPQSVVESTLLEVWKSVIGREDFGVTDNVFLLGADPLRAERCSELLRSAHRKNVSAREIMANPTIREQAALISPRQVESR
jgi:acyl-CoA synthetase (AMP-forming)/AMP-acid ligase II